jgi:hypothetical protein
MVKLSGAETVMFRQAVPGIFWRKNRAHFFFWRDRHAFVKKLV